MTYFYLEITRGIEAGKKYLLNDGIISIGRSPSNTISLHPKESIVSSNHLMIYKLSSKIQLHDLQSTNGTFVNNKKINEIQISAGDEICFGKNGPCLMLIESDIKLDIKHNKIKDLETDAFSKTSENLLTNC